MMFSRGFQGFGSCLGFRNGMMGGFGAGTWFIPMIFMAVLTLIFIALVVFAVKKYTKSNKAHANDSYLEELKIRFVKGEITEEDYMKKKNIIDNNF